MNIRAVRLGSADRLAPAVWSNRLRAEGWRILDPPPWAAGLNLDAPARMDEAEAAVKAASAPPPKKKARRKRTRRKGA